MSIRDVQKIGDLVHTPVQIQINYEWKTLQESVDRHYIRGIYSSLDRLCKLYKQRDIKA